MWRLLVLSLAGFVVAIIVIGAWLTSRPLPKVVAKVVTVSSKGTNVAIPWPNYGQAAIGAEDYGLLASNRTQKAVPMASVAKVVTSLAVLKAKPLADNAQGPTLILGQADVDLFYKYVAMGGSVVPVASGERITQRQALEAVLLPSANNMADSLAIWAFGGLENYKTYANKLVKDIGLSKTTITSATGFDVNTVSTADDLVKLGLTAMSDPVIASIVAKKTSTIPVAGKITNYNFMLGRSGIVGIKTGNTDEAGGCYLFAAKRSWPNGQTTLIVGAIMGAGDLATAQRDSPGLLDATMAGFGSRRLVKSGDVLAYYDTPWGGQAVAIADADLHTWTWKGADVSAVIQANDLSSGTVAGSKVGTVRHGPSSLNMVLKSDISTPSRRWRLTHQL